jgi:hypothetical protein
MDARKAFSRACMDDLGNPSRLLGLGHFPAATFALSANPPWHVEVALDSHRLVLLLPQVSAIALVLPEGAGLLGKEGCQCLKLSPLQSTKSLLVLQVS